MSSLPTRKHVVSPIVSGVCGATTLVGKLGYGVAYHTDGTVIVQASQGGLGFPLITEGAIGEPVAYAGPGVQCLAYTDGTDIAVGTPLTCEAGGRFEKAITSDLVTCIALEAPTAAGDFIMVLVVGPYISA